MVPDDGCSSESAKVAVPTTRLAGPGTAFNEIGRAVRQPRVRRSVPAERSFRWPDRPLGRSLAVLARRRTTPVTPCLSRSFAPVTPPRWRPLGPVALSTTGPAAAARRRATRSRSPVGSAWPTIRASDSWPNRSSAGSGRTGGWNCDRRPEAHRSSFHETLPPIWGLHEFAVASGDAAAADAARARAGGTRPARATQPRRSTGPPAKPPTRLVTVRALTVLRAADAG